MSVGSYNLDKRESRGNEQGTAKQMTNKGPREEANEKRKRSGE